MERRNNLRSMREGLGLTQQEVAVRAGMTLRYYQNLESGRSMPTIGLAANVAKILGGDIEDVWNLNDETIKNRRRV